MTSSDGNWSKQECVKNFDGAATMMGAYCHGRALFFASITLIALVLVYCHSTTPMFSHAHEFASVYTQSLTGLSCVHSKSHKPTCGSQVSEALPFLVASLICYEPLTETELLCYRRLNCTLLGSHWFFSVSFLLPVPPNCRAHHPLLSK
jgi:hypothetical protein